MKTRFAELLHCRVSLLVWLADLATELCYSLSTGGRSTYTPTVNTELFESRLIRGYM